MKKKEFKFVRENRQNSPLPERRRNYSNSLFNFDDKINALIFLKFDFLPIEIFFVTVIFSSPQYLGNFSDTNGSLTVENALVSG